MKKNIVMIGSANMSGHTEVPGGSLLEGADSAGLTHAEREMTEMLLTMFERRMRGGASYAEGTIELGMGAVRGFLNFVKLPPWKWLPRHVDEFISHKVLHDDIGYGRQSTYLTYLRQLQNMLLSDRGLCNEIHQRFGIQPQMFVNKENSIAIKRKGQSRKKVIKTLSAEECQMLIQEFDVQIKLAKQSSSKAYRPLMRDKTITMLLLMTGLRVEELVNLTVHNFAPDASYPNFGNYALLTVVKGKCHKTRVVRLYNPLIKDLMEWYLDRVRPGFLSKDTKDFDLLFLSERGQELCTEQVRRMLKKMVAAAGVSARVTPHILRHTYATQMAPIIGPEALQEQLGHEHLSTTLGTYYHQDPQLVGDTIRQGVNNFARAAAMMTEGL